MRPRKDHLWNNNFNRIYFLCVHVLGRDLPGNQKLCGKDACFFWLVSQSEVNMGSGNSAPVERAQTVETEAHQDVFELRFDHLAFGGTSILFLAALIGLCWFCRRRNKRRQRKRQNKTCHCHQSPTQPALPMNQSYPMQPMPPMPMPMPWYPVMPYQHHPTTSNWPPAPSPFASEPDRFTEIPEQTSQPPRPPPPRARELPPPTTSKSPPAEAT